MIAIIKIASKPEQPSPSAKMYGKYDASMKMPISIQGIKCISNTLKTHEKINPQQNPMSIEKKNKEKKLIMIEIISLNTEI